MCRAYVKQNKISTVGFCERSPSHPITLSASPTQLLVGQLTRLPFHSGYATAYMAARAGFEPTTLRSNGVVSTNAPPCPTNIIIVKYYCPVVVINTIVSNNYIRRLVNFKLELNIGSKSNYYDINRNLWVNSSDLISDLICYLIPALSSGSNSGSK